MAPTSKRTESLSARITALKDRHAELDERIHEEQSRPLPSVSRLRLLKRRKLMLKDEMSYYDGVLRTVANMNRAAEAEQNA